MNRSDGHMRATRPRENTNIVDPTRHTCTSYSIVEFVCTITIRNSVLKMPQFVIPDCHVLYNFYDLHALSRLAQMWCFMSVCVIWHVSLVVTCNMRCGRTATSRESRRSSSDVERKSVKERDGHFTARGQRARYTVADCAPIAVCGSRPAFVDPRDTLSGAGARPRCFHAPRAGWGAAHGKLRKLTTWAGNALFTAYPCMFYRLVAVYIYEVYKCHRYKVKFIHLSTAAKLVTLKDLNES